MGHPHPIGYCTLHLYGGDVQIDFYDLLLVEPHRIKWTVIKKGNTKYATAKILHKGKIRNVYMHRLILDFPKKVVDHIDRNGLNNKRANLRPVSPHANWVNSAPHSRGKSKYKGVSPINSRWRATIQAKRKWRQIGIFDNQEDAARAYDKAAIKFFGPTAYLNKNHFPL